MACQSVRQSVSLSVCLSVRLFVLAVNVCGSRANGGAASRRTTVTAVVVLVIAVVFLCNKAPVSATRVEHSRGGAMVLKVGGDKLCERSEQKIFF